MRKYKVRTDQQHFNWLKEIEFDIQRLNSVFQNIDMVITEEEFMEFNHRYLEVLKQLDAWHQESLRRIQLQKGE